MIPLNPKAQALCAVCASKEEFEDLLGYLSEDAPEEIRRGLEGAARTWRQEVASEGWHGECDLCDSTTSQLFFYALGHRAGESSSTVSIGIHWLCEGCAHGLPTPDIIRNLLQKTGPENN